MAKNKNSKDVFLETAQYLKDNFIPDPNLLYESSKNSGINSPGTHHRNEAIGYIKFDGFSEALQNFEKLYDAKNFIVTTEIKEAGKPSIIIRDA